MGGDVARAAATIKNHYRSGRVEVIVALDATNAYNSISRTAILKATYATQALEPAWRLIDLLLGQPSRLGVYTAGARDFEMTSSRGIR